jgi:energy-converting hydrogenase Eha subunit A
MESFDPLMYSRAAEEGRQQQSAEAGFSRFIAAIHPVEPRASRAAILHFGGSFEWVRQSAIFPTLNVIDLGEITPQAKEFAGRHGLSIAILAAICKEEVGFAGKGARRPVWTAEDYVAADVIRKGTGENIQFRSYPHAFLQAGGFVTIDPFTGERLVSTHSFVMHDTHIAYRFLGLEVFYIVVGGIGGFIRFCCIPRLQCLILNSVPYEGAAHKAWSIDTYYRLMAELARSGEKLLEILPTPRHATGVAVGFLRNFGHYIWQDLAGIGEIIETHGVDAVQYIVAGPFSKLSVTEVFPELVGRPMVVCNDPFGAFDIAVGLPCQFIRPLGLFLRQTMRERIYRVAEAHVPPDLQRRIAQLAESRFLIWVNLRSHNKTWVRQVEGHISVLRRLAGDVCNLTVLLDGWTDTQLVAEAIRAGLEPEIGVIDLIGCDVFETFLWSKAAHLYSVVVGTGLWFVSYFASRPGVAHGNAWHLGQQRFWKFVARESCPPTFLKASDVNDNGELYSNYDFDPDILYWHLRHLIETHYPERLLAKREVPALENPGVERDQGSAT